MEYLEVEKLHDSNDLNDLNDSNDSNDSTDLNDTIVLNILNTCGITSSDMKDLDGITIFRETLLNDATYDKLKTDIPKLKSILSSTSFTSMHKNADASQKWPLINLVRQLLRKYNYNLIPKRVCDGYSKAGIKKYKRLFEIKKDIII